MTVTFIMGPPGPEVAKAEIVSWLAHKGQKRRNGDDYWWGHTLPVMWAVRDETVGPPALRYNRMVVAFLHDVLEDTPLDRFQLEALGFNTEIIEAVVAITKREDELYREYIDRVKDNPLARFVKIRDIRHNLSDQPAEVQRRRYRWALKVIEELEEA